MSSLLDLIDPDRDVSRFTSYQQNLAIRLQLAINKQGLPEGFSKTGVHIRREKLSGMVYVSNKEEQMCMLNNDKLEMYYRCPKCKNEGFKNTIRHSSRCDFIVGVGLEG